MEYKLSMCAKGCIVCIRNVAVWPCMKRLYETLEARCVVRYGDTINSPCTPNAFIVARRVKNRTLFILRGMRTPHDSMGNALV